MKPERETNLKRLLVSGINLRVAEWSWGGRDGVAGDGHWGGHVLW